MSVLKITLAGIGAAVALVAAGCGGGGSESVPDGAVAVVDGTEIPRSELDKYVGYAKKQAESSNQEFPKVGTPQYQDVQSQSLLYLVQRAELRQAAEDLGITVTEKDVDNAEKAFITEKFSGKRADYLKALKAQGFTAAEYRVLHETSALNTKLFESLTKDVTVSDEDVLAYYTQNQANYPESRDVRHILVRVNADPSCKGDNCKIDYAASKAKAEELRKELEDGADFAALAKANSEDPGSKDNGGKYTVTRGQTVPEFDKAAFALDENELSQPVKTQFGYHLIEPTSPVRGSFESFKETVRATLLQQRKNEEFYAWLEDLTKKYEGKVSYADGFAAPVLPEVPTTATE